MINNICTKFLDLSRISDETWLKSNRKPLITRNISEQVPVSDVELFNLAFLTTNIFTIPFFHINSVIYFIQARNFLHECILLSSAVFYNKVNKKSQSKHEIYLHHRSPLIQNASTSKPPIFTATIIYLAWCGIFHHCKRKCSCLFV